MKLRANQAGDTLIEVVIAIILIGTILFSAYSLSSRAFRLGQSARERSQATQLLQQQAEGLRSLRDKSSSWSVFRDKIKDTFDTPLPQDTCRISPAAGNSGTFHLERNNDKWVPVTNTGLPDQFWNPGGSGGGQNPEIAGFYKLKIEGCLLGENPGDNTPDRLEAIIRIEWPRIGSSNQNDTTELYLNLTDRDLNIGG